MIDRYARETMKAIWTDAGKGVAEELRELNDKLAATV